MRIPVAVAKAKSGYFEDRRPNANIDPYEVVGAHHRDHLRCGQREEGSREVRKAAAKKVAKKPVAKRTVAKKATSK